jgi:hypothetical protein
MPTFGVFPADSRSTGQGTERRLVPRPTEDSCQWLVSSLTGSSESGASKAFLAVRRVFFLKEKNLRNYLVCRLKMMGGNSESSRGMMWQAHA